MKLNYFFCLGIILIFPAFSIQNELLADKIGQDLFEAFLPFRTQLKPLVDTFLSDVKPPPIYPQAEYVTCDVCRIIYPVIMDNLDAGATAEQIIVAVVNLCIKFEIEAPEVCEGTIRAYASPLLYIVINRPSLTGDDFCGILNPGCTPVNETLTSFQVVLDENKPPIESLPPLPEELKLGKILHLTDVHLDIDYVVGSNADCGKPLCCRDGVPETENMTAGIYGHSECALTTTAFDLILDHAATAHGDIKYVFLTGDYVHNGIWFYSQEENGKSIRYVTQKVAERFADIHGIYPLTGNHEPQVVNMYPPEELWNEYDLSWLYSAVAEPFPFLHQRETFLKGGYYWMNPEPRLKLVVINTNLCYLNNFWLAYDTYDPAGQLQWLADTMLEAERGGFYVYILGHIPPGSHDCWPPWSAQFDRIVNRFENIIKGQFYGHEHTESFKVSFEPGTERPLAMATQYLGPSGLPSGASSGYKVFTMDMERDFESTYEIVDHETWIFNTTASNENNSPVFEKVYSAKTEYGLKSLRGNDLYDFIVRMLTDEELFGKFQKNYVRGYPGREPCDVDAEDYEQCKMGLLCSTVTPYSGDLSHCERLEEIKNGTSRVI